MRVVFAGGGTAGHINPAIAIAKYIASRRPDCEISFIGTKEGLEATLIPKENFHIDFIDVRGFKRKLSFYNVTAFRMVFSSVFQAKKLLLQINPDVVVGTGGYVSGPVLYAAHQLKIPTVIHEQNALPGVTSRILSGFADSVCISFEESKKYFKKAKNIFYTGNPIRDEMVFVKKNEARKKISLDARPFVLSFAGSLGAREINKVITDFINLIKDDKKIQFMHSAGERGYKWLPDYIKKKNIDLKKYPEIMVKEYIYNMPEAMGSADLVISRAGAISLSEIAATGTPCILIPSPNVTNNHQYHNAMAFRRAGGAVVIEEKNLTADILKDTVYSLVQNREKLEKMKNNLLQIAVFDATQRIYDILIQTYKSVS